jgi:hypothetical protein
MTTAIGPGGLENPAPLTTDRTALTVRQLLIELTALEDRLREPAEGAYIRELVREQSAIVRELRRRRRAARLRVGAEGAGPGLQRPDDRPGHVDVGDARTAGGIGKHAASGLLVHVPLGHDDPGRLVQD